MIPIFARDIFHLGGADLPGDGCCGRRRIRRRSVLAYLGDFKRKEVGLFLARAFRFWLFVIAFAQATNLVLSLILLSESVLLSNFSGRYEYFAPQLVTDEMRGRGMACSSVVYWRDAIGNLLAGAVSHRFGAPFALAAGGFHHYLRDIVAIRNRRLRELR